MTIRTNRVLGWLAVSVIAGASPALADHHEKSGKTTKAESSPEARAKMADAHQKMAECLRSTRPIQECHAEMHKALEGVHAEHGASMGQHDGHKKNEAAKGTSEAAPTK